ncbi:hypothetical protein HN031_01810 [Nocardioides sp. zg-1308]|uniref:hypothetical protein n=1 Tax=Nocardioides sp. zg-1308 TaxID=2736253 RepID=UPI001552AF35|nr:hypothetical protein [Nocardioides sp. zg-1308]NPD03417.1 hypothetical protein [Nocardioides sp. zg-1308]
MNRITTWAAAAALAAGSLALATPAQAAPAKAASYKVTASVNKTEVVGKEDVVKVRGRVTPKAAGQKVTLQQRVGKKKSWKATGTAKIKQNGTYVLKDDPSTAGTRQYRVLKPASNGFAKGFSETLDVTVYRWQKLGFRTPGPSVNITPRGVTIGAEYFTASLATTTSGAPSSVEYTLGRKCTEMRATFALTDDSATGSSGAVTVSGDGAVLAAHALSVGVVVADQVIDIEDVFRLKLDLSTSVAPAAVAAVATPEVLCAG